MNAGDRGLVDELQLRADSRPRPAAILLALTRPVLLAMIKRRPATAAGPAIDLLPHVPSELGDHGVLEWGLGFVTGKIARNEAVVLEKVTLATADDRRSWRAPMNRKLTAIIQREDDGYVALCPEVDVVSQGDTVAEARDNLEEALTLFFETASAGEIEGRLRDEIYVTQVEVAVG